MSARFSQAHLVDAAPRDVQAMICAAAAANQTYKPQRGAAKPKPPGPRNMFQLLDDDVPDPEQHAAEGVGASAGAQNPTGEAALQRSASGGRAPAASTAAAVGAAATRTPAYLPPRLPPVQATSATPQAPKQQQAPPQPPLPQPALEASPPPRAPAPVEPAAPRPTSAPAVLLGDGAASNFECPLTMDVMEDPVCAIRVQGTEELQLLNMEMCAAAATAQKAVAKYSMRLDYQSYAHKQVSVMRLM
jgi:hypothetical protein